MTDDAATMVHVTMTHSDAALVQVALSGAMVAMMRSDTDDPRIGRLSGVVVEIQHARHACKVTGGAVTVTDHTRDALAICARVLPQLVRLLFPVELVLAQAAAVDEPIPDDAVVLSFMGSGASDRVTAGDVRIALAAAGAAMHAAELVLHASSGQDDATYWATVADGVSHDPRCRTLTAEPGWLCLRCQRDQLIERVAQLEQQLQGQAGRVVPPDWHGPADDF